MAAPKRKVAPAVTVAEAVKAEAPLAPPDDDNHVTRADAGLSPHGNVLLAERVQALQEAAEALAVLLYWRERGEGVDDSIWARARVASAAERAIRG